MSNIWQQLKRPIMVLAPMDDVTDTVFRQIVAELAPADLAMTEFASVEGFMHPKGRDSVERRLRVDGVEKAAGVPVIAQIWGADPDKYHQTAAQLAKRGDFAGIDINMGCPEKSKVRRGTCGGLIKNPELAAEIVAATKAGAGDLPVSVKTRIGLNQIVTEEWCGHLLRQNIAALTVHGRTVKEMSKVPAHWDEIGKVVKLRDQIASDTVIIGNGDVGNWQQASDRAKESGVDGVMIGRGVLHDIQAFAQHPRDLGPHDRVQLFLHHLDAYEAAWGDTKKFDPMKKFAKLYINGFAGAAELRTKVMETKSATAARKVLATFSGS